MGAGSAPSAPIEPVRISACDGSARRGPTAPAAAPRPPAGTHRWVPDDLAVVGFDGSDCGACGAAGCGVYRRRGGLLRAILRGLGLVR